MSNLDKQASNNLKFTGSEVASSLLASLEWRAIGPFRGGRTVAIEGVRQQLLQAIQSTHMYSTLAPLVEVSGRQPMEVSTGRTSLMDSSNGLRLALSLSPNQIRM